MTQQAVSAGTRLPRHVAIIMDGNGRWAEERQLPRIAGHQEGARSVRDIVRAARQIGVKALTLYAFSAQNWARPADEVRGLMQLLQDYLVEERSEILDNGIRLNTIGDTSRLPDFVKAPLEALLGDSRENADMVLTLALSYDGRESIARAARALAADVAANKLAAAEITVEHFAERMPTRDLPPLDLLIRTSGELRVSNFLLWEVAYSELYFSKAMWPDFRRQQFHEALQAYAERERRFGRTGAQIESGGDLVP